ncbi:homoserine O-succinyltransferase [Bacteroidia bacterium]|nr:homoserine O-succinyltransferase [Bacteroidia bacterium]
MSIENCGTVKIAILNLMPLKQATEADFLRIFADSPMPVEIDWLKIKNHVSKNTPQAYLDAVYKNWEDVREKSYDGLIITGAPVELLEYESVTYWKELQEIMNWAHEHVPSTLYICWAAQAALYHFYNIPKYPLSQKMFGIFNHQVNDASAPLVSGFESGFYVPHSRHTEIRKEDVLKVSALTLLTESPESGVHIVTARGGRDIFVTGHSEYAPDTLHTEYQRDLNKGLPIERPVNYYINDDPERGIAFQWRDDAIRLYHNWLAHYCTPI